jgi:TRAP-type uncharacterized transport system fused permease subunit
LLSVWGELSPPTSLTAAISARIAEASFMRTMWEALKICFPITLMTFAIFMRSDMVATTGWPQIEATVLVMVGTCGIAFAMFGRYLHNVLLDIPVRLLLAALAFVTLLHPDERIATTTAIVGFTGLLVGLWRHRQIAPPTATVQTEDERMASPSSDLSRLATEARREIG